MRSHTISFPVNAFPASTLAWLFCAVMTINVLSYNLVRMDWKKQFTKFILQKSNTLLIYLSSNLSFAYVHIFADDCEIVFSHIMYQESFHFHILTVIFNIYCYFLSGLWLHFTLYHKWRSFGSSRWNKIFPPPRCCTSSRKGILIAELLFLKGYIHLLPDEIYLHGYKLSKHLSLIVPQLRGRYKCFRSNCRSW